jgi:hypothetical protein
MAQPMAAILALASCVITPFLFWPMVRFYRLNFAWALTLPLAAVIYVLATIDSARLSWLGKGGLWKGRTEVAQ